MQNRHPEKINALLVAYVKFDLDPAQGLAVYKELLARSSMAKLDKLIFLAKLLADGHKKLASMVLSYLPKAHEIFSELQNPGEKGISAKDLLAIIQFLKEAKVLNEIRVKQLCLLGSNQYQDSPSKIGLLQAALQSTALDKLEKHTALVQLGMAIIYDVMRKASEREAEAHEYLEAALKLEETSLKSEKQHIQAKGVMARLLCSAKTSDLKKIHFLSLCVARKLRPKHAEVVKSCLHFVDLTIEFSQTSIDKNYLVVALDLANSLRLADRSAVISQLMKQIPDEEKPIDKAAVYFMAGKSAEANEVAESILIDDPENEQALKTSGLSAALLDLPLLAVTRLTTYLKVSKEVGKGNLRDWENVYLSLSACCVALRKYPQALIYADKCLEINPNAFFSYLDKAIVYASNHDFKRAKAMFAKAQACATSSERQAILDRNLERFYPSKPGSSLLDETAHPDEILAGIQYDLDHQQFTAAKTKAAYLAKAGSDVIREHFAQYTIAFAEKDYDLALKHLLRAKLAHIEASDDPASVYLSEHLMKLYYLRGEHKEAEDRAWHILAYEGRDHEFQIKNRLLTYTMLFTIYTETGREAEGIEKLRVLRQDKMTHKERLVWSYRLASLAFAIGDYPAVELYFQPVFQSREERPSARSNSLLGISYFHRQMYSQAIARLHVAVKLDPEDVSSLLFLGHAYFLKGETDQERALGTLAQALTLDPFCFASISSFLPAHLLERLRVVSRPASPELEAESLVETVPQVVEVSKPKVEPESKSEAPSADRMLLQAEQLSSPPRQTEKKKEKPTLSYELFMHQMHQAAKNKLKEQRETKDKNKTHNGWLVPFFKGPRFVPVESKEEVSHLSFRDRDRNKSHVHAVVDEEALKKDGCDETTLAECKRLVAEGNLVMQKGVGVRLLKDNERTVTQAKLKKDYAAKIRFFSLTHGARVYGELVMSSDGKEKLLCFNRLQMKHI